MLAANSIYKLSSTNQNFLSLVQRPVDPKGNCDDFILDDFYVLNWPLAKLHLFANNSDKSRPVQPHNYLSIVFVSIADHKFWNHPFFGFAQKSLSEIIQGCLSWFAHTLFAVTYVIGFLLSAIAQRLRDLSPRKTALFNFVDSFFEIHVYAPLGLDQPPRNRRSRLHPILPAARSNNSLHRSLFSQSPSFSEQNQGTSSPINSDCGRSIEGRIKKAHLWAKH